MMISVSELEQQRLRQDTYVYFGLRMMVAALKHIETMCFRSDSFPFSSQLIFEVHFLFIHGWFCEDALVSAGYAAIL